MQTVGMISQAIFGGVWSLLLGIDYPGLGVSLASLVVALVIIRFSIRVFQFLTGFGGGSAIGRATNAADKAKSEYDRRKRQSAGLSD